MRVLCVRVCVCVGAFAVGCVWRHSRCVCVLSAVRPPGGVNKFPPPPFLPGGQVCMQFLRMLVHMRVFVCVLSAGRPTGVLTNPLPRPPHTPAPGTAPLYPFPFPLPLPVAFPCPSRFPPLSLICSNLALLCFTLRSRHDLAPNGRGCPPEMCGSSGRSDPN